ncbi:MAG: hypothetical protein QXS93_01845 [Candidatus Micrarchaeia archaeon]
MARFLVLGNESVFEDGTAVRLMPLLKKEFPMHEFVVFDPNESLPVENKDLLLIDVVRGIKRVEIFTEEDIDRFSDFPKVGVHDFDLTFQLKLLLRLGKIKNVRIIGIPHGMDDKTALAQAVNALRALRL